MARKKRNNDLQPIGVGLTAKQMKRKKPVNSDFLVDIQPLTENQEQLFNSYKEGKHLVASVSYTHLTLPTIYSV